MNAAAQKEDGLMTATLTDELRAELVAAIEAANLESPEQVADLVLSAAAAGGRDAGLASLRKAVAVDHTVSLMRDIE